MTIDPNNWPEARAFFETFEGVEKPEKNGKKFLYGAEETRESDDGSKLYIGRAGVDGIEFVYLKDTPGIWAWYPLDGELTQMADTIDAFVTDWASGAIKV